MQWILGASILTTIILLAVVIAILFELIDIYLDYLNKKQWIKKAIKQGKSHLRKRK